MGNDDSGPEDVKDDEDLECGKVKIITSMLESLPSKSLPIGYLVVVKINKAKKKKSTSKELSLASSVTEGEASA